MGRHGSVCFPNKEGFIKSNEMPSYPQCYIALALYLVSDLNCCCPIIYLSFYVMNTASFRFLKNKIHKTDKKGRSCPKIDETFRCYEYLVFSFIKIKTPRALVVMSCSEETESNVL